MSDPFIGEIRIFAGNFNPRGWSFCSGQLLPVSQHDALFSLYGTIYGGDGRSTFALPELRGRAAVHQGTGPGLSNRRLGQKGGVENVSLTESQSGHTHELRFRSRNGGDQDGMGVNEDMAASVTGPAFATNKGDATDTIKLGTITKVGANRAHQNMQPWLALNYICSMMGTYPSRS